MIERHLVHMLMVLAFAFLPKALAVPSMNVEPGCQNVTETDGKLIQCVTTQGWSGNFYDTMADGKIVVTNEKGKLVYALTDDIHNIMASDILVNSGISFMPKHVDLEGVLSDQGGNEKGVDIEEDLRRLSNQMERILPETSGTLKHIVVPIRFSDHVQRELPSTDDLEILFNSQTTDAIIAPTGSVKTVFATSSFDELDLHFTILPTILVSKTQAYYANGEGGLGDRFWEALREALQYIDDNNKNFRFDEFDDNDDGIIDAITFLTSSYGAEHSRHHCPNEKARRGRIWSHKNGISPRWQSTDGKIVQRYSVSPLLWRCGEEIGRIGVIAHEIGHLLGLPDLYDYGKGNGIGSFGLMGSAWGFDNTQNYPAIMSPWSKNKLGWLTCRVIDSMGTYTLRRASEFNECFRIDFGFPSGEYLYVENRNKYSFDLIMPQDGLMIWHIDVNAEHNYNTDSDSAGYPGSVYWPNSHYITPVLQADGEYQLEKGDNNGDAGDVFHGGQGGIDRILSSGDIMKGPFPNTDSYQGGNLARTNIEITNISISGSSMTFDLSFTSESPSESPTKRPTSPEDENRGWPCVKKKCKRKRNRPRIFKWWKIKWWKIKCSRKRRKCGGCPKCLRLKFPCKESCKRASRDWELKCSQRKACAGCDECKFNPHGRTMSTLDDD